MRASRTRPGTTTRCAAQHPDRSAVQVRNTKQPPTSMPAVEGRIADFHRALWAARMDICCVITPRCAFAKDQLQEFTIREASLT